MPISIAAGPDFYLDDQYSGKANFIHYIANELFKEESNNDLTIKCLTGSRQFSKINYENGDFTFQYLSPSVLKTKNIVIDATARATIDLIDLSKEIIAFKQHFDTNINITLLYHNRIEMPFYYYILYSRMNHDFLDNIRFDDNSSYSFTTKAENLCQNHALRIYHFAPAYDNWRDSTSSKDLEELLIHQVNNIRETILRSIDYNYNKEQCLFTMGERNFDIFDNDRCKKLIDDYISAWELLKDHVEIKQNEDIRITKDKNILFEIDDELWPLLVDSYYNGTVPELLRSFCNNSSRKVDNLYLINRAHFYNVDSRFVQFSKDGTVRRDSLNRTRQIAWRTIDRLKCELTINGFLMVNNLKWRFYRDRLSLINRENDRIEKIIYCLIEEKPTFRLNRLINKLLSNEFCGKIDQILINRYTQNRNDIKEWIIPHIDEVNNHDLLENLDNSKISP